MPESPENPLEPPSLPSEEPGGGAARALLLARFAVYALVVALGGHYLLSRDDDARGQDLPRGVWVQGETTQRLPVSVKLLDTRVVAVKVDWRGYCSGGQTLEGQRNGFPSRFRGDLDRDGQRFRNEWRRPYPWDDGRTGSFEAHLKGESAAGVARGSVSFTIAGDEGGGRAAVTCESGPIGFAVDLPR